jgi:predicted MPP superfamily phosphohydrolase
MSSSAGNAPGLTRRDFLKFLKVTAIDLTMLAAGGAGYGLFVEPGWLRIEQVNLKLQRLTPAFSGIRIAQVSDIHIGGWMNAERLQHVVDLALAQEPDLLLLTGDFLIGHVFDEDSRQAVRDLMDILPPLAGSIPSFAVLGNHDYWTSPQAVREMLRACKITDLTNAVFTLKRGSESLHLCGVDDIWEGDVRLDVVLGQVTGEGAALLLAHEPDFADTSAATGRFDLQVSGHSHGGQVVIPFYGPPVLPHLGRKYPSGLYQVGHMYQYTNRGVGMIEPAIRFNCPPEITVFTLETGE